MSVKKFQEFINEAELNDVSAQATEVNLESVKKEIDDYKLIAPKLKPMLKLEPAKAEEEFKKVSNNNSLLILEWEILKMEDTINKAKELIQNNTKKVQDLIKERQSKLTELTNKLNSNK